MKTNQHRAFSLLELLLAVGVLVILAAVLWPIFARPRGSDHSGHSCQNNLKQIALGFKQYINDFDERYPIVVVVDVTTGTNTYAPPYGWVDALQPYIKNTQVFQCPSDTNEGSDINTNQGFTDYWYNANFIVKGTDTKGNTFWAGVRKDALGSSSQTIIAGDGGNTNGTPSGDARYNQWALHIFSLNPLSLCAGNAFAHFLA